MPSQKTTHRSRNHFSMTVVMDGIAKPPSQLAATSSQLAARSMQQHGSTSQLGRAPPASTRHDMARNSFHPARGTFAAPRHAKLRPAGPATPSRPAAPRTPHAARRSSHAARPSRRPLLGRPHRGKWFENLGPKRVPKNKKVKKATIGSRIKQN